MRTKLSGIAPQKSRIRKIPPPPPKKSGLDKARNTIARMAAQTHTNYWRSAIFLKRIRKQTSDSCW
jgi:hypothetical protein